MYLKGILEAVLYQLLPIFSIGFIAYVMNGIFEFVPMECLYWALGLSVVLRLFFVRVYKPIYFFPSSVTEFQSEINSSIMDFRFPTTSVMQRRVLLCSVGRNLNLFTMMFHYGEMLFPREDYVNLYFLNSSVIMTLYDEYAIKFDYDTKFYMPNLVFGSEWMRIVHNNKTYALYLFKNSTVKNIRNWLSTRGYTIK